MLGCGGMPEQVPAEQEGIHLVTDVDVSPKEVGLTLQNPREVGRALAAPQAVMAPSRVAPQAITATLPQPIQERGINNLVDDPHEVVVNQPNFKTVSPVNPENPIFPQPVGFDSTDLKAHRLQMSDPRSLGVE